MVGFDVQKTKAPADDTGIFGLVAFVVHGLLWVCYGADEASWAACLDLFREYPQFIELFLPTFYDQTPIYSLGPQLRAINPWICHVLLFMADAAESRKSLLLPLSGHLLPISLAPASVHCQLVLPSQRSSPIHSPFSSGRSRVMAAGCPVSTPPSLCCSLASHSQHHSALTPAFSVSLAASKWFFDCLDHFSTKILRFFLLTS